MRHLKTDLKAEISLLVDSANSDRQENVGEFLLVRRLNCQHMIGLTGSFVESESLDRSKFYFNFRLLKDLPILLPDQRLLSQGIRTRRLIHHQFGCLNWDSSDQRCQNLSAGGMSGDRFKLTNSAFGPNAEDAG